MKSTLAAIRPSVSVILLTALTLFGTGCRQQADRSDNHTHVEAGPSATGHAQYVCPMHPQVTSDKPGKCPVCGMDLVVASTGALMLTPTQERLANIRVQKLASAGMNNGPLISARIVADEDHRKTISSRAAGRIEKLYMRETGRTLSVGQPLYDLYSEPLNSQIQEYLILKDQFTKLGNQQDRYASLLKGAENKLLLYGLTQKQIATLTRENPRVTFLSPTSGTVSELLVSEGQYVDEGALMFRLDNLAKLWLEAELYPNEAQRFQIGDAVTVRISGREQPVDARVSFLTPVFRENAQVLIMRATIDNSGGNILPGMQATLQRQQQARLAFQLPIDAVIRDETNAYTFVRAADHTYQVRLVKTGTENADAIEITDGLSATDEVVVSGAYLLYSELVLRNGADFMAHINH